MARLQLRRIDPWDSNPKKADVSESRILVNYLPVTGYALKDTKEEIEEILFEQ